MVNFSKGRSLLMFMLAILFIVSCSPSKAVPASTASPTTTPVPSVSSTPSVAAGTSTQSEIDGMLQLYIPAGKFLMGTQTDGDWIGPDEFPQHEVYLDAFWMDKTEITNREYHKCITSGECTPPHSTESETRIGYFDNPEFADFPVIQVDWEQANEFCKWAGRRLPTEAEWEKSARGVTERLFPWNGNDKGPYFANFGSYEKSADTFTVGSILSGASPYGLLDMAGNVYEWTADWYAADYYTQSPEANPLGPQNGTTRVIRGGAWSSDWYFIRTASRLSFYPDLFSNDIGFRCAQSK